MASDSKSIFRSERRKRWTLIGGTLASVLAVAIAFQTGRTPWSNLPAQQAPTALAAIASNPQPTGAAAQSTPANFATRALGVPVAPRNLGNRPVGGTGTGGVLPLPVAPTGGTSDGGAANLAGAGTPPPGAGAPAAGGGGSSTGGLGSSGLGSGPGIFSTVPPSGTSTGGTSTSTSSAGGSTTSSGSSGGSSGGTPGAVPEPETWGMLMMGIGATGLILRRRRKLARATA